MNKSSILFAFSLLILPDSFLQCIRTFYIPDPLKIFIWKNHDVDTGCRNAYDSISHKCAFIRFSSFSSCWLIDLKYIWMLTMMIHDKGNKSNIWNRIVSRWKVVAQHSSGLYSQGLVTTPISGNSLTIIEPTRKFNFNKQVVR